MVNCFVVFFGFCLLSGAYCLPSGLNGTRSELGPDAGNSASPAISLENMKTTNSNSSNVTEIPAPPSQATSPAAPGAKTSKASIPTPAPETTIPANLTTSPTTTSSTTPTPITTPSTPSTTPTTLTTLTTTETTTSKATTTATPSSSTPVPTPAPSKDRRFDGPSFIGGIVLSLGIMAIAFVAFKFYKARTERNYHTL